MTTLEAISTQWLTVKVTATDPGDGSVDPTADPVEMAMVVGVPEELDWLTAEWVTVAGEHFARILVGPEGTIALDPGVYDTWVRVHAGVETPVQDAGELIIVAGPIVRAATLVSVDEFIRRVPEAVQHEDQAQALLEDASALVLQISNAAWVSATVPAAVAAVVVAVTARALANPGGAVDSESISADTYTVTYGTHGVYLTPDEIAIIGRSAGRSGLWTQSTTRSEDDIPDVPTVLDIYPGGATADTWAGLGIDD